jgi:hypothetical protein
MFNYDALHHFNSSRTFSMHATDRVRVEGGEGLGLRTSLSIRSLALTSHVAKLGNPSKEGRVNDWMSWMLLRTTESAAIVTLRLRA